MIGFYNYTVILTYIGMLSSFTGIILSFNGKIYGAVIALLLSGLCDMFDGKIASTKKDRTKEEKMFGIQIDSLSDLICFGVLPAVIVYAMNKNNVTVAFFCGFYVLCALIRLSFFNVDEANRQEETDERRTLYLGMPVTSSAVIFPLFYYICTKSGTVSNIVSSCLMCLIGLLFISPLKLKKPGMIGKVILSTVGIIELVLIILK